MENKNVFISYKSEEIGEADWVRSVLENSGISCWMAPACIPGGSSYASEIPKAIKSSRVFVLILSSKAQQSKWVAKEVDLAINEGKIIMPFMLENCPLENDFNFYLTNVQRYAAYEDRTSAINKMIREIKEVIGAPGSGQYDPYRFFTPTGSYSGTRPEPQKSAPTGRGAGVGYTPTGTAKTPPDSKNPQTPPSSGYSNPGYRTPEAGKTQGGTGTFNFPGGFPAGAGVTTSYTPATPAKKKKRYVFIALSVFFYLMTLCGLMVLTTSYSFELVNNIGITVFYLIFAVMFHILALSPKHIPNILGKTGGMKKSTFVILMVIAAFAVGIICNGITEIIFSYYFYDSYYG